MPHTLRQGRVSASCRCLLQAPQSIEVLPRTDLVEAERTEFGVIVAICVGGETVCVHARGRVRVRVCAWSESQVSQSANWMVVGAGGSSVCVR